jgi:peptidoglycan L-alanyl-D-glutamate endopeptidase CwlK
MKHHKFSKRSLRKMKGVHPELIEVAHKALELTDIDFGVTCGLRTVSEQRKLVSMGKSRTMNSRHLTGHAIDVVAYVNGKVSWEMIHYVRIANAFKMAAKKLGVQIECGADWGWDGPHIELDRKFYPA